MGTGHYTHNLPLQSGKCSAYEGGIRVPMIVSWAKPDPESPNQQRIPIKPGSICDQPVFCDDYLPTLCHWAGVKDLEHLAPVLDGHDITGYVTGLKGFQRGGPLVFHYPHFINYSEGTIRHGYGPFSAMREGDWKVIYFYDRKKWELHDLSIDPGEKNDLASARPEQLRSLAEKLVSILKDRDAQYPVVIETGAQVTIELPQ